MFRLLALISALFVIGTATPPQAQEVNAVPSAGLDVQAPAFHSMLEAIGIYELLAIMANENAQGATDLENELFPGRGGAAWSAIATRMHSADRIVALFEAALDPTVLNAAQLAELESFFRDEVGTRIVAGELAARRAFLEAGGEDAANDLLMEAVQSGAERLTLLERFNSVNELVDRNVTASLNASYAFYQGLAAGGAFDVDVPDDLMIAEVWSQEAEVRRNTVEWLYAYQLLAYSAMSDAEFESYIDLTEGQAGTTLNAILFQAFETVFTQLSYELGQAAAGFMATDDI